MPDTSLRVLPAGLIGEWDGDPPDNGRYLLEIAPLLPNRPPMVGGGRLDSNVDRSGELFAEMLVLVGMGV